MKNPLKRSKRMQIIDAVTLAKKLDATYGPGKEARGNNIERLVRGVLLLADSQAK